MGMSEWAITRTLRSKGLSQKEAEESGSVAEKSRRLVFGRPEEISRNCFPVWSFERIG